jgi:hypothetical protein
VPPFAAHDMRPMGPFAVASHASEDRLDLGDVKEWRLCLIGGRGEELHNVDEAVGTMQDLQPRG